jgi:hypothetical protein
MYAIEVFNQSINQSINFVTHLMIRYAYYEPFITLLENVNKSRTSAGSLSFNTSVKSINTYGLGALTYSINL